MKKINSVGYGGKVIGIGMLLMVVVPVILCFISKISKVSDLTVAARVSGYSGAILLLLFALWLCIELKQDSYLNAYYAKHADEKISLANGSYECQVCGNRLVRCEDLNCKVCGNRFQRRETKDEGR